MNSIQESPTPFVVISRNRYSLVKDSIEFALRQTINLHVYIADMESTYPPLLEYLSEINSPRVSVIHLSNIGPRGLWLNQDFKSVIGNSGFFLTDGDLDYSETSNECCAKLIEVSRKYPGMRKIGSALRIDDLDLSVKKQSNVFESERDNWNTARCVEDSVYLAPVDTQLAYYPKHSAKFYFWPALRVANFAQVRHAPWYEDPKNRTEEETYYMNNAKWWGVGGVTSHEKEEAIGNPSAENLSVLRYSARIIASLNFAPRISSFTIRYLIRFKNRGSFMDVSELGIFLK